MKTVLSFLVQTIRASTECNIDIKMSPACILWPDGENQWKSIINRMQQEMPELFILGNYDPGNRTGPAIWLRCVIAGKIEGLILPEGNIPILYLPGISKKDLKAVEKCPGHLQPLAELQYRGVFWTQENGKDWTILAFLKSEKKGLSLDVAQDNDTKKALELALSQIIKEDIDSLCNKRLDNHFFYNLLIKKDLPGLLLQWLDHEDSFRAGRSDNEWHAFLQLCKSELGFDPENDGASIGAYQLASREEKWQKVWDRLCEAPEQYSNIPAKIRKCQAPSDTFFSEVNIKSHGGFPQWNEEQEDQLRQDLIELTIKYVNNAKSKINDLEKKHCQRRTLPWAKIGEAPLANALEYLTILAEIVNIPLRSETLNDISEAYKCTGHKADYAVLGALSCINRQEDWDAVIKVIHSIYLPWLQNSARLLQKIVVQAGYPFKITGKKEDEDFEQGTCLLFVDGLRFDLARQISEMLNKKGYNVKENICWAALPSITTSAKPAVAPVKDKVAQFMKSQRSDKDIVTMTIDFIPCNDNQLKKLLSESGWKILNESELQEAGGLGWYEFGNIDHLGHNLDCKKFVRQLNDTIKEIKDCIAQLLEVGWKIIHVVTDHGWLLMPEGLPKIDLPAALAENKWHRYATIKPGALSEEKLYPWFWDENINFAIADGISCYNKGEEYAHGGLSLQECLMLELIVTKGVINESGITLNIAEVRWRGLRCTVTVEGNFSELLLDIRTKPANASSSIIKSKNSFKEDGAASVVVENEELIDKDAFIIILDKDNRQISLMATIIGGGKND